MPFPRKLLQEDEDVLVDLHPHWWFLVPPIALLLLAVVALVLGERALSDSELPNAVYLATPVIPIVWLGKRYLTWLTTNFVVTTDRLVYRSGIVSKHGMEIPLERVNNIAFSQTVFERMVRAGDLLIESGGEQGQQRFTDIANPVKVQNEIYGAIEDAAARDAHRATGQRELSVPEQLDKLDDLRQRGVISQAEFDAKKAQLLDRM